jgi:hypothetical protein
MKGNIKCSFNCAFVGVCGMMRSLKSNINIITLKIEVRLFLLGMSSLINPNSLSELACSCKLVIFCKDNNEKNLLRHI